MKHPIDPSSATSESVTRIRGFIPALYRRYSKELFAYGRRITPEEELIKDAIQDVFYRLLLRLDSIESVRNFKVYLFVALKNYILKEASVRRNHRRHQQRYSISNQAYDTPDWYPDQNEQCLHYRRCIEAMDRLPPRERDILRMRYLEGMDYKEISLYTSGNHQVVRNYACRAIKRIRQDVIRRPAPV